MQEQVLKDDISTAIHDGVRIIHFVGPWGHLALWQYRGGFHIVNSWRNSTILPVSFLQFEIGIYIYSDTKIRWLLHVLGWRVGDWLVVHENLLKNTREHEF